MPTKFLLPNRCKPIGWFLAIPSFILMVFAIHFGFAFKFLDYTNNAVSSRLVDNSFLFNIHSNNFTDEVGGVLLIVGLLMIAFSKEKQEDEWIAKLRLESLMWAVYVNSIFLILSIIFFYNELFLNIISYNLCTPLILFIIRFNLVMYSERRRLKNDLL